MIVSLNLQKTDCLSKIITMYCGVYNTCTSKTHDNGNIKFRDE